MAEKKLKLPTTLEEYDLLVAKLTKTYKLKDPAHTSAVLSVAIRHLPPTQAYSTLEYFGHYILKSIANHVADHKSKLVQHENHIDQLVHMLIQNPYDFEARDAMEKAANDGSNYARTQLEKLENPPPLPTSLATS